MRRWACSTSQWPLIGAWALLVAIGLFVAWRFGRGGRGPRRGRLNLVAAIALLLNAWSLAGSLVDRRLGGDAVARDVSTLELHPPDPDDLPDVYYVILDRYAGPSALAETYDFDNEPFLTALEEQGFDRRPARARQLHQDAALAGQLAEHGVPRRRAAEGGGRDPARIASRSSALLGGHLAVPTALKELGYQYIHVSNWWPPSITNVDADRTFHYEGQDEFSTVLAQTTLLRAFTEPEAAPTDPWDWRVLRGALPLRARPTRRDPRPARPQVRLRAHPSPRTTRTSSTATAPSWTASRSRRRASRRAIGASSAT